MARAVTEAPELSVVVPVYRSAETLRELVDRLDRALAGERVEYVFVVDASPDQSLAVLEQLRRERRSRPGAPLLRVLDGARNRGQHAALRSGFARARGRALIVLDADLQYAPEELPRLVAAWRDGADLVAGFRSERRDARAARVLPSRLFNALARRWSGVSLRDFGCGFCLFDARLAPRLEAAGARKCFLKPLLGALAERAVELPIRPAPRTRPSSYGFARLARLALAFAIGWSPRPFRILTAGALVAALGFAALLARAEAQRSALAWGLALALCAGLAGIALLRAHARLQQCETADDVRELDA